MIPYRNLLLILCALLGQQAMASTQFPVQARLYVGATNADPSNLNQELKAQNLQEHTTIYKYGAEATYALTHFLDIGMGYQKRNQSKDETDSNIYTDYQSLIDQDTVYVVTRFPFFRSNILRVDVFGALGGSNSTIKIKTASQDGELTRREGNDWLASLYTSYGASVAVGYKMLYFVVEAGYENNKVDSFKRTGTVNGNIQAMDLSGGYLTIGLLFDGVTATKN